MTGLVLKLGTRPPWVGLAAAVWVEFAAANAYSFPLYSPALKGVLGLSQQQLTLLGVALDIGENVGILPGMACNKFPPWVVLLVGAFHCLLGYGVIWLAVSKTVQLLPFWLLWLALLVGTNSNSWFGTSVLVTNMKNFPLNRGTIAGTLKGYVGICGAVYSVIYSTMLNSSALNLLLFLALGLPVLCLVLMSFVRPCTPASQEDSSDRIHFYFIQAASVALAIYLIAFKTIGNMVSLSDAVNYTSVAVMVVLMLSPLAIPVKMTFYPKYPKSTAKSVDSPDNLVPRDGESNQTDSLLVPSSSALKSGNSHENGDAMDVELLLAVGHGAVRKRRPRRGEDFRFREALVKADFWLLWFAYFLGVGSGVTFLNNLAQIGIASGLSDSPMLLSLFCFCNFTGRLGAGVISEHFVRSRALPRTIWMIFAQVIMIIAFLLYSSAIKGTLYIATALVGVCYGVQYSAMIPTASEIFGLKNFGVIYNFMMIGNPLGALLFSSFFAGLIYDTEAAKQGSSSTCLGPTCFRLTFLVLSGVCGLATLLSIILYIRIRPVYQTLYSGTHFRLPQSSSH